MRNSSSLIENDTFPFKQVLFINDVHCVLSIAHELEEPFFSGCYEVFVVCMHLLQRNVFCVNYWAAVRHQLLKGNKLNWGSRGYTNFNYMKYS